MESTVMKGERIMDKKIVSISAKRQITILQKFFTMLGFEDEAECVLRGNELILRPARITSSGEFAENILADLIKEGYSGDELLCEFKKRQAKVRPAIEEMLAAAKDAAAKNGEYMTYDDIFGKEE